MTITTVPSYPFDPTGTKLSNKITGEQQVLTASNPRDNFFLIPDVAPFFGDSMSVTFKDGQTGIQRPLVPNVDFYCTHLFLDASYSTAKPIYGSITMLNTSLAGIVTLAYQTVGDQWVPSDAVVAEALANRLGNPRATSWEQIVNPPNAFPVIAHEYDLVNMKGLDSVVTSINALTSAIAAGSGTGLTSHKADFNNPHQTTADQVGAYDKGTSDARATQIANQIMAMHIAAYHS